MSIVEVLTKNLEREKKVKRGQKVIDGELAGLEYAIKKLRNKMLKSAILKDYVGEVDEFKTYVEKDIKNRYMKKDGITINDEGAEVIHKRFEELENMDGE